MPLVVQAVAIKRSSAMKNDSYWGGPLLGTYNGMMCDVMNGTFFILPHLPWYASIQIPNIASL